MNLEHGQTQTNTDTVAPSIVRCEETGRCWQVESRPDAGCQKSERQMSNAVVLKRGELVITVPVETVFEKYTVVC